ncbi:MAG: Fe-S oxidoreductase [Ignavibacteriae bacterium]|nr:MAG: Fe-S oxidoreductase [Ignavibacteriota bacterium]
MNLNNIIFVFVFSITIAIFAFNITKFFSYLKIGKKEIRTDKPLSRLWKVLTVAFGQTKLLREPAAGLMHFFIFWGFLILLSAIFESIGEGFNSNFSLSFIGDIYIPLIILQEFIALFVILSVIFALFRRITGKPKRLKSHSSAEAYLILFMILMIMLSMYLQNSVKILIRPDEYSNYRVIASSLQHIFTNFEYNNVLYHIFWWIHIGLVFVFLNLLPFSKHFHIITSIPNVFFARLNSYGELRTLNLNDENLQKYGVSDVEDLTWKQLFDGYTCTECGRCTASCPANITGKLLSPREIIINIRKRLIEKAPIILSEQGNSHNRDEIINKNLVDKYITEEELWACTTCLACVNECPVMIEHVDHIVDMRRFLVLNESRFPKELQIAFQNLERNYNPWSFSSSAREDWASDLNVPIVSNSEGVDLLFWVGCAGAFDDRAKKVSRAMVKILHKANIKFAILGNEEKCTGDFARRSGNEYLAQMLINENISTLNKYKIKRILTTCPHCYNTLKNEYPAFGGRYEVIHHSEFIENLISDGKIILSKSLNTKTVYHDSCYLGRYNGIYNQPRKILKTVSVNQIVEMKRNKDKGFCCGAGGARMFMEETEGKRINHERTDEALALNVGMIGTACPFCLTMLSDGVKDRQKSDEIAVKDIAEIVADALIN